MDFGEYTDNKTMKSYFEALFEEQSHDINTMDWPNNVRSPLVTRETGGDAKRTTKLEAAGPNGRPVSSQGRQK